MLWVLQVLVVQEVDLQGMGGAGPLQWVFQGGILGFLDIIHCRGLWVFRVPLLRGGHGRSFHFPPICIMSDTFINNQSKVGLQQLFAHFEFHFTRLDILPTNHVSINHFPQS